jgi:putative aminopeptidase FrvX
MTFAERPHPTVDAQRVKDNFIKLVGIDGVYRKEQAIGEELGHQLKSMGFAVKQQPDGTLIGTLPGTVPDAPTVLLSAHQDTVMPTTPESIRVDKTRIRTDGTHVLGGDDRAGCAQILEGVRSVLEQKADRPEIKVVFPIGEEAGLKGAAALRPEDISHRPTLGFVCDSTAVDAVYLANDSVIITPSSLKYNYSQEDPLVQIVLRSMATAGTRIRLMHCGVMAGAGTDGNTPAFNTGHIRSIAVGAGERDIHTGLENIKIDDLTQGARHVVGYITNACDLKVDGDAVVPRH